MKIKIPPYPNFKITEQAFNRDVVLNSVAKSDSQGLSNQLVMITEFKTGERRVIKARPVKYLNQLFVTAFPNPIARISDFSDNDSADLQSVPTKRMIEQEIMPV